MTDHPNAELVRSGYAAMAGGDADTFLAMLADDIKWHFPGKSAVSGDFEGKSALLAHVAAMAAAAGSLDIQLVHMLADDTFAVAIEHVVATKGDKRYDRHDIAVFRMKDGRVAEGWAYVENLDEWEALLS
ncbi:MAG: nuclear transport factor 2 family protein [Actinobacteria bacterium]|nr:nuclear transport factor 2 family protein [Actinomycetota bacterium]